MLNETAGTAALNGARIVKFTNWTPNLTLDESAGATALNGARIVKFTNWTPEHTSSERDWCKRGSSIGIGA